MKSFFTKKLWPVLAGFIIASVVMMIFEGINSFLYPLPKDLNWMDTVAVHAVTQALPWTAYILVYLGWAIGSVIGAYITTYLAREKQFRLSLVLGVILAAAGLLNNLMIGTPAIVTWSAIPLFLIATYAGHRFILSAKKF